MPKSRVVLVASDQLVLLSNLSLSRADWSSDAVVRKVHAGEDHLDEQMVEHDVQNGQGRAHKDVSLALPDEVVEELNLLDIEIDFRVR